MLMQELLELLRLLVLCELLDVLIDELLDWLDEDDVAIELSELLELDEVLLELDELLDELLSSASCLANTQMLYVTGPPFAVSVIWLLLASVTGNPSVSGLYFSSKPPPRSEPPVATVWVPIGVQPFATAGMISKSPTAPTALLFLILMAMIS